MMRLVAVLLAIALPRQSDTDSNTAPAATPRLVAAASALNGIPGLTLLGYEVAGASPRAVRQSINQGRRVIDPAGDPNDAFTRWRFRTVIPRGADGQCRPAAASVIVAVTITLPDLASRDALSARERADWDRYFAALLAHEKNHARIAVAGAEQTQAAMRAASDCALMAEASRAGSAAVSEASRLYDRQTEHGKREGAVYPLNH